MSFSASHHGEFSTRCRRTHRRMLTNVPASLELVGQAERPGAYLRTTRERDQIWLEHVRGPPRSRWACRWRPQ